MKNARRPLPESLEDIMRNTHFTARGTRVVMRILLILALALSFNVLPEPRASWLDALAVRAKAFATERAETPSTNARAHPLGGVRRGTL